MLVAKWLKDLKNTVDLTVETRGEPLGVSAGVFVYPLTVKLKNLGPRSNIFRHQPPSLFSLVSS